MTKHPGASLNRAAYHSITSHGMDSSHTKQATPWRARRKTDFLKFIPSDTFYAVVRCEQAIDKDGVTLQQLTDTTILTDTQKVSERLIDFFASSSASTFVEVAIEPGIKLKEIEAFHIQPLVHKPGHKFIRTLISNHSIDLLTKHFRLTQLLLLG